MIASALLSGCSGEDNNIDHTSDSPPDNAASIPADNSIDINTYAQYG